MRKPKMSKDKKVLVQLRLSINEANDLRKAGEMQGRKLPAEIMQRLRASLSVENPEAVQGVWVPARETEEKLYGNTAESVIRNCALGQAVGHLAAQLERTILASDDPIRDRAIVMAKVRLAVAKLLELLGAKDEYLTSDDRLVARAFAIDLARKLAMAGLPSAAVSGQLPEAVALARIARGLNASITEWAKNFLGSSLSSELEKPNDSEKA
jgi:hypothetical protein